MSRLVSMCVAKPHTKDGAPSVIVFDAANGESHNIQWEGMKPKSFTDQLKAATLFMGRKPSLHTFTLGRTIFVKD